MDYKKLERRTYQPSQRATQAQAALDQVQAQRPADYTSKWADQRDQLLGSIRNRQPFRYDINKDALYNQYKDQYIRGGRLAMMDTMGQAAALTGGYGSSYAQHVGQQTFQGYLAGLNDKVPELYQQALEQYNREGDDLYKQYGLLGDRETEDYGRYQDALSVWLNDRNYLGQQAQNERAFDYAAYRDAVGDDQWTQQYEDARDQYLYEHPDFLEKVQAIKDGTYEPYTGGGGGRNQQDATLNSIAEQAKEAESAGYSKSMIGQYVDEAVSALMGKNKFSVGAGKGVVSGIRSGIRKK